MPVYVIHEIWTRSFPTVAESQSEALRTHDPRPVPGLNLSNWHATEVPVRFNPRTETYELEQEPKTAPATTRFVVTVPQAIGDDDFARELKKYLVDSVEYHDGPRMARLVTVERVRDIEPNDDYQQCPTCAGWFEDLRTHECDAAPADVREAVARIAALARQVLDTVP